MQELVNFLLVGYVLGLQHIEDLLANRDDIFRFDLSAINMFLINIWHIFELLREVFALHKNSFFDTVVLN